MINDMHPFTLEIVPNPRAAGSFDWLIRKSGKLIQRSDRTARSADDARKAGEKEIERQFANPDGR